MVEIANGGIAGGAEKHAGLEGKTGLECCDASMPVLSVWESLDTFLSSAAGVRRARSSRASDHNQTQTACTYGCLSSNPASCVLATAHHAVVVILHIDHALQKCKLYRTIPTAYLGR